MNYGEWNAEKKDGIYFRKIIRYDVDSVLAYARTLDQMKSGLEDIGYVVDLTGKHWTLKHPQSQRSFDFINLVVMVDMTKIISWNESTTIIYFQCSQLRILCHVKNIMVIIQN